jgi:gluconolactonase
MIYVWSSAGRILETHPAPADRPINCAFGDGDLGSLYVTTAEGHLFRVRNSGLRGGPPS